MGQLENGFINKLDYTQEDLRAVKHGLEEASMSCGSAVEELRREHQSEGKKIADQLAKIPTSLEEDLRLTVDGKLLPLTQRFEALEYRCSAKLNALDSHCAEHLVGIENRCMQQFTTLEDKCAKQLGDVESRVEQIVQTSAQEAKEVTHELHGLAQAVQMFGSQGSLPASIRVPQDQAVTTQSLPTTSSMPHPLQVAVDHVKTSFNVIDANGDGMISRAEFVQFLRAPSQSQPPSPSQVQVQVLRQ